MFSNYNEKQCDDEIELGKLIDSMKNIKERLYKLENNSDVDNDTDINIKNNDSNINNKNIMTDVIGCNVIGNNTISIGSCVGMSISKPKNIFFGSELPMYIVSDFYNKQLQTILESITNTLDKLNTRLESLENHRINNGVFNISI